MFRLLNYYTFCFILPLVQLSPIIEGYIPEMYGRKYPFMVSLQEEILQEGRKYYEKKLKHFCGGTLLNDEWILTAAHCVWHKNLDVVFAVIGFSNLQNAPPEHHFKVLSVEFTNFQWTSLRNDIALLQIQRLESLSNSSELYARLPSHLCRMCMNNNSCKIIGYGARHYASSQVQHQLNEGEVSLIDNCFCRLLMGRIWAPESGDNKVCALSTNYDTCEGDSGGPLICDCNGIDYVYGIISHGSRCGVSNMPSIYILTAPYWKWINDIIIKKTSANTGNAQISLSSNLFM